MSGTAVTRRPTTPNPGRRRHGGKTNWKALVGLLALAGIGGAAYLNKSTKPYVVRGVGAMRRLVVSTASAQPPESSPGPALSTARWDGLVPIDTDQWRALGLRVARVEPQTEPMQLELHGATDYDQDTLTSIRPRFNSLVKKVFKTLGDHVKKDDPLVELYSDVLAEAKNNVQVQYVEWLRSQRLYFTRKKLFERGAISEVEWTKTRNDEATNHLEYYLARLKLIVFGLTPEEIDQLIVGLDEESMNALKDQDAAKKASMTLRAPADGYVIKRDVVQGNLYEPSSVLMVIAPLDHLRVYGNVYESDLDLVQIGQEMEVVFPYLDRSIPSHVQVISNQVDPETHAMRIRTTIKNPGGRLKADMIVRMYLKVPPVPGFTIVPRNAVVTSNGKYAVFILKSGAPDGGGEKSASAGRPAQFERREVEIKQERNDQVIVSRGLRPGEYVATNASLILEQMYEDLSVVDTGTPP